MKNVAKIDEKNEKNLSWKHDGKSMLKKSIWGAILVPFGSQLGELGGSLGELWGTNFRSWEHFGASWGPWGSQDGKTVWKIEPRWPPDGPNMASRWVWKWCPCLDLWRFASICWGMVWCDRICLNLLGMVEIFWITLWDLLGKLCRLLGWAESWWGFSGVCCIWLAGPWISLAVLQFVEDCCSICICRELLGFVGMC